MRARKREIVQPRMFQVVNMETLVPQNHILRKLNRAIAYDKIHEWVSSLYTESVGRPAVDPVQAVRLVLLCYLFNHSERELFETVPMHVGYLWFLGLDFENIQHPAPSGPRLMDRTALVKTRKLWRKHGIFEALMHHVVSQCIAAGLVKADVHAGVDGTQVRANASIHSMKEICTPVTSLQEYLKHLSEQDQSESGSPDQDDEPPQPPPAQPKKEESNDALLEERSVHEDFHGKVFSNHTHRSATDPEARLYRKSKGQETHLRYLVHHVVDLKSRVILSTQASMAHGHAERETSLEQVAEIAFAHPSIAIRTLSADKAYGATDYLNELVNRNIIPLIPLRNMTMEEIPSWKRKTFQPERQKKRDKQVRDAMVRNLVRNIQKQGKYRQIQKLRAHCEHAFAEGKEVHGLGRARGRGLSCMQEQALLTAVVQNLKRLCRFLGRRPKTGVLVCPKPNRLANQPSCFERIYSIGTSLGARLLPILPITA